VLLSILAVIIASCGKNQFRVNGNGQIGIENRDVPAFEGVVLEGSMEVIITPDTITEVIVEAETNLIPFIETYVSGTALIVRTEPNANLRPHDPIRVFVRTPILRYADLDGSGFISTGQFVSNTLDLSISGSGRLETGGVFKSIYGHISGSGSLYLDGTTSIANYSISGSGNIDAYTMQTDSCYVHISGSGNTHVSVIDLLDVNISGSGSVYYKGDPLVFTNISGSGLVIQVP